jgi:hypothetical protein
MAGRILCGMKLGNITVYPDAAQIYLSLEKKREGGQCSGFLDIFAPALRDPRL